MEKENAKQEFIKLIEQSWTYAKLTKEERTKFIDMLSMERFEKSLRGTYNQRWEILNNIYFAFLEGLGYKPFGWREEEEISF